MLVIINRLLKKNDPSYFHYLTNRCKQSNNLIKNIFYFTYYHKGSFENLLNQGFACLIYTMTAFHATAKHSSRKNDCNLFQKAQPLHDF